MDEKLHHALWVAITYSCPEIYTVLADGNYVGRQPFGPPPPIYQTRIFAKQIAPIEFTKPVRQYSEAPSSPPAFFG